MAVNGIGNAATLVGAVVTDGTTHASNIGAYGQWQVSTEEGVTYLYHAEMDPSDTDAEIVSPGIKGSWVNGQKIVCGITISNAGANVEPGMKIEGSADGKNWAIIGSEFSADLTPDSAQTLVFTADLSSYTLPWYRLSINDDTTNMTTIKFNFFVSGLNSDYTEGLGLDDVSDSFVGGLGKDPS
jgi:hypothetical protein